MSSASCRRCAKSVRQLGPPLSRPGPAAAAGPQASAVSPAARMTSSSRASSLAAGLPWLLARAFSRAASFFSSASSPRFSSSSRRVSCCAACCSTLATAASLAASTAAIFVCELLLSLRRLAAPSPRGALDGAVAGRLVDVRDDELGEVEDALQAAGGDVQQQADAAGRALDEPDVGHGRGQLDVAHALAAHLAAGHLHAALVADDALVADALVLAAVALEVLGGPEDLLAEEAVLLRLQGAVVDGLRLGHLAVGPGADLLRRSQGYADGVEVVNFKNQVGPPPRNPTG